jgi:hypothetical protein
VALVYIYTYGKEALGLTFWNWAIVNHNSPVHHVSREPMTPCMHVALVLLQAYQSRWSVSVFGDQNSHASTRPCHTHKSSSYSADQVATWSNLSCNSRNQRSFHLGAWKNTIAAQSYYVIGRSKDRSINGNVTVDMVIMGTLISSTDFLTNLFPPKGAAGPQSSGFDSRNYCNTNTLYNTRLCKRLSRRNEVAHQGPGEAGHEDPRKASHKASHKGSHKRAYQCDRWVES